MLLGIPNHEEYHSPDWTQLNQMELESNEACDKGMGQIVSVTIKRIRKKKRQWFTPSNSELVINTMRRDEKQNQVPSTLVVVNSLFLFLSDSLPSHLSPFALSQTSIHPHFLLLSSDGDGSLVFHLSSMTRKSILKQNVIWWLVQWHPDWSSSPPFLEVFLP